jgi:hypothetical protein
LNALLLFPQDGIKEVDVEKMFTSVFESMVNNSGLMISRPPLKASKDAWEYEDAPKIHFFHPKVPLPGMAGGKFGRASVFA